MTLFVWLKSLPRRAAEAALLAIFAARSLACSLPALSAAAAARAFARRELLAGDWSLGGAHLVLVHGSSADSRQFAVVEPLLARAGVAARCHAVDLPHGDATPIEALVDALCERIPEGRRVVLLGVSMGGLVAARFAAQRAAARGVTVHRLVAVATPFGGAPLLEKSQLLRTMLATKRHEQMTPGSEFLRETERLLAARAPGDFGITSFGSDLDLHVPEPYARPAACAAKPADRHVELPAHCHFRLASAAAPIHEALHALAEANRAA